MKKLFPKIFMFGMVVFFFACSKDKEPTPDNTTPVKPGITESAVLIQAPTKLKTSDDPMAQTAAGYIDLANALSSNFSLFEVPPGATQSNTPIVPSNGRLSGNVKYYVYTWSDAQSETHFTYQVGEVDDNYTFEMFWKLKGQTGWTRLMIVEENKAKTLGKFIIYDFTGSNTSKELFKCDWSRIGDAFKLKLIMENALYDFDINSTTGAGKVSFYNNNKLFYKMNWDAAGNGTWAQYDDDGIETQSGNWTV